jgi:adenosylcobinamide-GDP ribazoletransferase
LALLSAIRFLTSIPLPFLKEKWEREDAMQQFARSLKYYPVVGLLIGLILAVSYWALSPFLPHTLLSALLLAELIVLSGGLHLDGFIDTTDGIAAGHADATRRKSVMKDSSVGAIGVVAVAVLLLVKFVALNSVPGSQLATTLVLMAVLGRWAMVYAVFNYPYARSQGMGDALRKGTGWGGFIIATVIALAASVLLAQLAGAAIMAITWLAVLGLAAFFKSKFAGLTGDTYGAINELAETLVLIIVAVLAYNGWV